MRDSLHGDAKEAAGCATHTYPPRRQQALTGTEGDTRSDIYYAAGLLGTLAASHAARTMSGLVSDRAIRVFVDIEVAVLGLPCIVEHCKVE